MYTTLGIFFTENSLYIKEKGLRKGAKGREEEGREREREREIERELTYRQAI